MKKAAVILLALCALGCFCWYKQGRQMQKAQDLILAAYDGDLTGVKNAIEAGSGTDWLMYIDDPDKHYSHAALTPLMAAASGGNAKAVLYLVRHGQEPNQTNEQGWTALFVAARDGQVNAAKQLILLGADPNMQTDTGATALMLTVLADFPSLQQRLSLLEYLLKKNADPNLYTRWETDALFYAVTENKDPAVLQTLLSYQADPCRTYEGKTLIDLARATPQGRALLPLLLKARKACPAAASKK